MIVAGRRYVLDTYDDNGKFVSRYSLKISKVSDYVEMVVTADNTTWTTRDYYTMEHITSMIESGNWVMTAEVINILDDSLFRVE